MPIDLTGADLTGVDLTGINLTGAYLTGVDLTGANLTGVNLTGAYLTGANLTGAYLNGANLTRANLTGVNLENANLTNANLTRANLTRAYLRNTDLTNAIITGANLTNAILERPRPAPAPAGVAYEIHNAFDKINIDKYYKIIDQDDNKTYDNVVEYVQDLFTKFINQHFTEEDKTNSIEGLNQILEKLSLSESRNIHNKLIGKSVDFVMKQPKEFIDFYIRAFIQDCYHAYSGEDGLSCVKGIIERFVFITGDTAFAMCPDDCANKTYTDLKKLFGKNKADKNELTQQWANTYLESDELQNMSKEQRKEHYINFMENEYKTRELLSDENKQMIQKEADNLDYVFESLQFGGKSKKNTKKNTKKTSKKTSKKIAKKNTKKTSKKTSKKNTKKNTKKT
jgi:uncharacterized protein YjbI with pentapeptide repeats